MSLNEKVAQGREVLCLYATHVKGSEATTRGVGKSGPRGMVQYVWSFRERVTSAVVLNELGLASTVVVRLPCEGCFELVLE